MCRNDSPAGIGTPKKCLSWLVAMRMAAPAVKPTTTECDTKLTSAPMRASPSTNWYTPARKVSVSAIWMNLALPGSANLATVANTTIEIAVVGPEIRWREEPNNAAMIGGTMAVYRPYTGGRPAMSANATPCGSTITAPVKPATRSAFSVVRLTRGHQRRNGKNRVQKTLHCCDETMSGMNDRERLGRRNYIATCRFMSCLRLSASESFRFFRIAQSRAAIEPPREQRQHERCSRDGKERGVKTEVG